MTWAATVAWGQRGYGSRTRQSLLQNIWRWWRTMGQPAHPTATRLLITGRRRRQQRFLLYALETGVAETGRRDRLVDRRLSFSSRHQQVETGSTSSFSTLARTAANLCEVSETIVSLIAATATSIFNWPQGACRDQHGILPGRHWASPSRTRTINIRRDKFHGDWKTTRSGRAPPKDRLGYF